MSIKREMTVKQKYAFCKKVIKGIDKAKHQAATNFSSLKIFFSLLPNL